MKTSIAVMIMLASTGFVASRVLTESNSCKNYYSSDRLYVTNTYEVEQSVVDDNIQRTTQVSNTLSFDLWRNNPTANLYGYSLNLYYVKSYRVANRTTDYLYYGQNVYFGCSAYKYDSLVPLNQTFVKTVGGTDYVNYGLNKTKTFTGYTTFDNCWSDCTEYRPESGWVSCSWSLFPPMTKMEFKLTMLPVAKATEKSSCINERNVRYVDANPCKYVSKWNSRARTTALEKVVFNAKFTQVDNTVQTFPMLNKTSATENFYATANQYNSSNYYSICNGGCYVY